MNDSHSPAPRAACQCSCGCTEAPSAPVAMCCADCRYIATSCAQSPRDRLHQQPDSLYFSETRAIARLLAAARKIGDPERYSLHFELCCGRWWGDIMSTDDEAAPAQALMDAIAELQAAESAGTSSGTSTGQSQAGSSASDPPR